MLKVYTTYVNIPVIPEIYVKQNIETKLWFLHKYVKKTLRIAYLDLQKMIKLNFFVLILNVHGFFSLFIPQILKRKNNKKKSNPNYPLTVIKTNNPVVACKKTKAKSVDGKRMENNGLK